jgi:hypothetical protein
MATVHCPNCKAPIQFARAKNCTHCGAALTAATQAEMQAEVHAGGTLEDEPGFWRENWPWIVGPIVVAAVIVVIAMVVMGDGDDSSPFIYGIW